MTIHMNYETAQQLTQALKEYATKMTPDGEGKNVGSSPLGVWMLLASLLTPHSEADDVLCEKLLHMNKGEASRTLHHLLENVPVPYSAKGWYVENKAGQKVRSWVQDQEHIIPLDHHLPTQDELDEWANTHTDGIIKQFPLEVDSQLVLLLANALYSKLTWEDNFDVIEASPELSDAWNVKTLLHRESSIHSLQMVETSNGDVYAKVTVQASAPGETVELYLPSVHNKDTSNKAIIDAIYADDMQMLPNTKELFTEHKFGSVEPTTKHVSDITMTLPAWEISNKIDLVDTLTEVTELVDFLWVEPTVDFDLDATQVMKASFHKEGFEAAAITAIAFTRASMSFDHNPQRYNVIFSRPFGFVSKVSFVKVFSGVIHQGTET